MSEGSYTTPDGHVFMAAGTSTQHIEELRRELDRLTDQNNQDAHRLSSKHQIKMNIPPSVRFELLLDFLGEEGIWTEQNRLDYELKFQHMVKGDLDRADAEIEKQMAAQRAQEMFVPGGNQPKKIILPGQPGFH